jgi:hypothetical protein
LPAKAFVEEVPDCCVALVLAGFGWHREPGVLCEQLHERFHLAALEGVREPCDQLLFLG